MRDLVEQSINGSLVAQWTTLFANFYGLSLNLAPTDFILKEILGMETMVQIIELIFYHWYRNHIKDAVVDVTRFRYYDWAITTPIMLFSTMAYYAYLYQKNKPSDSTDKVYTIYDFFRENAADIAIVGLLNFMMLFAGYLQEVNVITITTSSILGFAAFAAFFYIIYRDFASKVPESPGVYRFMVSVWGLYGFAAMLPNHAKNISYNILDVIAKNFYGLYLSYIISDLQIK